MITGRRSDCLDSRQNALGLIALRSLCGWSLEAPDRFAAFDDAAASADPEVGAAATAVLISRDGRYVASGAEHGVIRLWNTERPNEPPRVGTREVSYGATIPSWSALMAMGGEQVSDLAMSADARRVAAASLDGQIRIWHLGPDRVTDISTGMGAVGGLALNPDGTRVAAGIDRLVKTWDTERGTLVGQSSVQPERVSAVAFSPDGRLLAAGYRNGSAQLWNARSGQDVATLDTGGGSAAVSLAFDAAGTRLAVAHRDGVIAVWDLRSYRVLLELTARAVSKAAFSSDGTRLLALDTKGAVTVFDSRSAYDFAAVELHRRLLRQYGILADVVRRLRTDAALSPRLREATERMAESRGDLADELWTAARQLAQVSERTRQDYERALAYADAAVRLMPSHPLSLEAQGMAIYRLGRYTECLAALKRAVVLRDGYELADLVFLRMAVLRLGQAEEAHRLDSELVAYRMRLQHEDVLDAIEVSWLAEMKAVEADVTKLAPKKR